MAKYVKWLAGALGMAFVGPIGALIGFAIGALLESSEDREKLLDPHTGESYRPDGFTAALLVLTAAVMKADGKIARAELDYVKEFFKKQFGADKTKRDMLLLREILQKDFSLYQVSAQVQAGMDHASRLQLMHYLIGIAMADGFLDERESHILKSIAHYFNINNYDFESIRAMYSKHTLHDAYAILEADAKATDDEIKKAYRKVAAKFHPDRVSSLGEEHIKAAEDKFKKVQDAYEQIRKQRGIKN
jgi:DnaJ like chaperone protein